MNRPPIPAEHLPILAKVAQMMLEHLRAEEAKKTGEEAAALLLPPDSLTVAKPKEL